MVNSLTMHSSKHATKHQQLTFCGINAHFQNGIAKRSICDLSESMHKQLLHACACWPQAVHFALWPYALRNAALLHNSLPVLEDGTSRLKLFSSKRGWLQHEACAHFWLPGVHVAKRTSFRQSIATMVTSRVPWAQSWTWPIACKNCLPGTQLNYRVCLTTVSQSLQQLF
jgi:hypothetical protein